MSATMTRKAGLARKQGRAELTREFEPGLLDWEDQARYTRRLMGLRAEIKHIAGHATALNGLAMCSNGLLDLEAVEAELQRLGVAVERARGGIN